MIPVGKYTATALDAELGITDGEGKEPVEYVVVKFRIDGGLHDGAEVQWRGYFSEKARVRSVQSLHYCGWGGNWDTWEGLGQEKVTLDVKEDRDLKTGEIRGTRVAWVNALSSVKPLEGSARSSFAARMKGVVAEVLGSKGRPARAPAASTGPRPTNGQRAPQGAAQWDGTGADAMADDIPFLSRGAWLWVDPRLAEPRA